jgi:acetyl-CoA carboxylase biotin carboxyl carrier protein
MTITHEDVRKLLALLDQSGFEEVHIELGDLKLDLRRTGGSQAQTPMREEKAVLRQPPAGAAETAGPNAPPAPLTREAADRKPIPAGVSAVTAPMVGTFYRAPSPGAKPFVEVGDQVKADDTVCLLEVMKLFNSLKAGVDGTVEAIVADNAAQVAAGEPLVLIRNDAA